MKRVEEYLRIPDDPESNRYSLRWSGAGDAVEWADGETFAFASAISVFLEGYALRGPLIHFSYILSLLRRFGDRSLKLSRMVHSSEEELLLAFRRASSPYRNAGAFCAWLCHDIPPYPDPPDLRELGLALSNGPLMAELMERQRLLTWSSSTAELPELGMNEFEARFLSGLKRLSRAEMDSWFRHGRSTLPDPGDQVADAIEALRPRSLEGALAALAGRERLAGAVPMVAQLVGALALPPRRLAHRALPIGGYADIGTRGHPDQILPSQFAVDDLEFLRRFAENELLYFHREEPHTPLTEELVLLIDQGVRTWGRVRHALSASALAFGRIAARRGLAFRVASTGTEGRLLDPIEADPEALGVFWEATDLSPSPGPALGRILEARPDSTRDVVVLSHPRSVAAAEFSDTARRASPGTRVFSVAIDEPGAVEFREWRAGGPIKVGDFRVDYAPPEALERSGAARTEGDPRGWRGDVEPVGYPFRFGVVHRIDRPLFDFDHAGRWLLLCTHRGMLHAWKLDGSRAEVLPRGMVDGEVLEHIDAVLGVADGFVVGGHVGKRQVVMHYDLAGRVVRAHVLGPVLEGRWDWFYCRAAHTVVSRGSSYSRALDLATGERSYSKEGKARPTPRAIRAFEMAANHALPPPSLAIVNEATPAPGRGRSVQLDRLTGQVQLRGESPPWEDFIPMSDGRATLAGCWVDRAQLRGETLALLVSGKAGVTGCRLLLFSHPAGVPSTELLPISGDPSSFILSEDGLLIARRSGERQIEVREAWGSMRPVFETAKGRAHQDLKLTLGRYGMVIHVGRHINLIRWDRGRLDIASLADGSTRSEFEVMTWAIDRPAGRSTPRPEVLAYDPRRFVSCARAELTAVVDSNGQVALFDQAERLLAMFVAFRSQVAAWMPDGTRLGPCHGPSPLIDGPATPDAAERIGRALKAASDAAKRDP